MQSCSAMGATWLFIKVCSRMVENDSCRLGVDYSRLLWRPIHPRGAVVMPKVYGVAGECGGTFPFVGR
jgi:hypothetical protein